MAKISLSMGYKTVIEGVEDEIEADYVKGLGCHHAQGYLFGKPMPIDELVELSKR
jgi:EAL domain-containing protein (putative c-di-GMP-specific phosphodiesterase class I)